MCSKPKSRRTVARACRLRTRSDDIDLLVPLLDWNAPEHGWPKAGAYPLMPFSNRIRDARLMFQNETHALAPHPLDAPNVLHGHAQRRAWDVAHADSQRAELVLDSAPCGDWPWHFEARIGYELTGRTFAVSLELRNRSDRAMPDGIGWHPFFATDARSTMHFHAARHEANAVLSALSRADRATHDCVDYVSEWDGAARIERDAGTLRMSAEAPLTHLVAYAARGGPFVCLESVSHVENGFNLAAGGIDGTGMQTLEPGAALAARVTLAWECAE